MKRPHTPSTSAARSRRDPVSDNLKTALRVVVAAAGVTVLALVSSPGGSTDAGHDDKVIGTTTIAACVGGEVTVGPGPMDWRKNSIEAGPVGIRERPLREMTRGADGSLSTEMPVLVEGHDKVTVAIVSGQRDRALLFYGPLAGDADGGSPGFERIRFHPCKRKERTVWPGGIRVEGSKAVRLKIIVAGDPSFVISLGRPKAAETEKPAE